MQGGLGGKQGPAGTAEDFSFFNLFKDMWRISDYSYVAIAKEISNEFDPKLPADRHIDD
jgi:hypothetical protein